MDEDNLLCVTVGMMEQIAIHRQTAAKTDNR